MARAYVLDGCGFRRLQGESIVTLNPRGSHSHSGTSDRIADLAACIKM
jgi:hypothetical protein